jgi:hypothetical protein
VIVARIRGAFIPARTFSSIWPVWRAAAAAPVQTFALAKVDYIIDDIYHVRYIYEGDVPNWVVEFDAAFDAEHTEWPEDARDELLSQLIWLHEFGPQAGRPRVDTLNGSKHANMKELRFSAGGGEWRVAFAFDPKRHAILLVGGDKSGGGEQRFYRVLIATADDRFDQHLARLRKGG